MPGVQIDKLMDIWAAFLLQVNGKPLFTNHKDLYKMIDRLTLGDIKWSNFAVKYTGPQPDQNVLPWMKGSYEVYFCDPKKVVCNMLANPDFAKEFDLVPYQEYDSEVNKRCWCDFMSADWAWKQAVSSTCGSY